MAGPINIDDILGGMDEIIEGTTSAGSGAHEVAESLGNLNNFLSQLTTDGVLVIATVAVAAIVTGSLVYARHAGVKKGFKNAAKLQLYYSTISGNLKQAKKIVKKQEALHKYCESAQRDEKKISKLEAELKAMRNNYSTSRNGIKKRVFAKGIDPKRTLRKYIRNAASATRLGSGVFYKLPYQEEFSKKLLKAELAYHKSKGKKQTKHLQALNDLRAKIVSDGVPKLYASVPSQEHDNDPVLFRWRCMASANAYTQNIFKTVNVQYPDIGSKTVYGCRISYGEQSNLKPIYCDFNNKYGYQILRARLIAEAYETYKNMKEKGLESVTFPILLQENVGTYKKDRKVQRIETPEKLEDMYESTRSLLSLVIQDGSIRYNDEQTSYIEMQNYDGRTADDILDDEFMQDNATVEQETESTEKPGDNEASEHTETETKDDKKEKEGESSENEATQQ